MRANWIDALDHVTARGARMLNAYAGDEDLFMKIGRSTVTVAVTDVQRATKDEFEIHWEERILETGRGSIPRHNAMRRQPVASCAQALGEW